MGARHQVAYLQCLLPVTAQPFYHLRHGSHRPGGHGVEFSAISVTDLVADWLDKDRKGTLQLRPLAKSPDKCTSAATVDRSIETFWAKPYVQHWPIGVTNQVKKPEVCSLFVLL